MVPCLGSRVLASGPPGKSPAGFHKSLPSPNTKAYAEAMVWSPELKHNKKAWLGQRGTLPTRRPSQPWGKDSVD